MELRNCPECGRLFTYVARNLCPACLEREEEFFKKVESFLKEHGGATVSEISEATGVPEDKIISFLRAGRLISSSSNLVLECERCGKPIRIGRFCDECRSVLESSLKRDEQKRAQERDAGRGEPETGAGRSRMHTAELYRKSRSKS
ncbi:MAG TPA: MerR family transcriptional regulator [Syntrophomonadaceae bacterium]|nr:MerR family transcriptional regulator [Syntrophomonadaceae bacterium]